MNGFFKKLLPLIKNICIVLLNVHVEVLDGLVYTLKTINEKTTEYDTAAVLLPTYIEDEQI